MNCDNCGGKTEEVLYCSGNGEPCFEACDFYRSNLNPVIRFLVGLIVSRKPRPDCEQACWNWVCEDCGEVYKD